MRKLIWFPIWKIDELENKLSEYEEEGYRVSEIKYSYFYYFKKVEPKKTNYYISYVMTRDESMFACERYVKGSQIPIKYCFYSLCRTGEDEEKMKFIRSARMDYIKSVLIQKMLFCFALFLMFLLLTFLNMNKVTDSRFAIYIVFLSIFLFYTYYYLFGFIKQLMKCKKFEKSNKLN